MSSSLHVCQDDDVDMTCTMSSSVSTSSVMLNNEDHHHHHHHDSNSNSNTSSADMSSDNDSDVVSLTVNMASATTSVKEAAVNSSSTPSPTTSDDTADNNEDADIDANNSLAATKDSVDVAKKDDGDGKSMAMTKTASSSKLKQQEHNSGGDGGEDDDSHLHRSAFADIARAPPNAIFKLQDEYTCNKHENKSNLVLGVAVNDDGSLVYFDSVSKVEAEIHDATQAGRLTHGYPPIGGLPELSRYAAELVLGEDHTFVHENKIRGVQALSGTGALRLVAEFLTTYHQHPQENPHPSVFLSNPTWANHKAIFSEAGFADTIKHYSYYDQDTCGLDFDGLMADLGKAQEGDIVVLHACAHNPTGVDPTPAQWTAIADLCRRNNITPIFDCAYLGFASGDLDTDAEAMRHFANAGLEFFVCMSFSKNFGIYGQRCGSALFVSEDSDAVDRVVSQLKRLSRPLWSVPPLHGARIVTAVLGNPEYRAHWKKEVRDLAERIKDIRKRLRDELEEACAKRNVPEISWEHITRQRGMFTYSGLTETQVEFLKTEHNIYMLSNGRINVCGVSTSKLSRIAAAIAEACAKDAQDQ